MPLRLFVDLPLVPGASLQLSPAATRHVQVRRLQPGDPLVLFDGRGGEWAAQLLQMGRSAAQVRIGEHDVVERELPRPVTLAIGVPANERMDMLVEKATELGAIAVQPLLCERSVLRLDGDRALRKVVHWQAVAVAAAEQCGRTRVPAVAPVCSLDGWLRTPLAPGRRLLLTLATGASALRDAAEGAEVPVLLLSGPEGGLAPDEEQAARRVGFVPVTLGARVLRADTAPLAALAWLAVDAAGDTAPRARGTA